MDTLKKMFGGGGDSPTEAPQEESTEAPKEESTEASTEEENTQM